MIYPNVDGCEINPTHHSVSEAIPLRRISTSNGSPMVSKWCRISPIHSMALVFLNMMENQPFWGPFLLRDAPMLCLLVLPYIQASPMVWIGLALDLKPHLLAAKWRRYPVRSKPGLLLAQFIGKFGAPDEFVCFSNLFLLKLEGASRNTHPYVPPFTSPQSGKSWGPWA